MRVVSGWIWLMRWSCCGIRWRRLGRGWRIRPGVGTVVWPNDAASPAVFSVDSLAVAHYGAEITPETMWKTRPIFEVAKADGGVLGDLSADWAKLEEATAAVLALMTERCEHGGEGLPPLGESLGAVWKTIAQMNVPLVYLKQQPAVENTRFAAYQAVVQNSNVITNFAGAGLLPGPWKLTLHSYDSCRVVEAMGLETAGGTAGQSEIVPLFSFWAGFTFDVEPGTVVWRAT